MERTLAARIRFLIFAATLFATPVVAVADVLDYNCVVGEVAISLQIDTAAQKVLQTNRVGSVTEVGEYSNGVFGRISHIGAAGDLIPSVHQFVVVDEDVIYYGAELHGTKQTARLDRRSLTLTLPSGSVGWCSRID